MTNVPPHLKTLAQQFNLNQLITEDTRIGKTSSTLLDHIYTNDNTQNYSSGTFTLTDSDHSAIFVIHKKKSPKVPSKIIETRNFSKVNWDKLNEDLKLLDLENKMKRIPNPDDRHEFFETECKRVFDAHAPIKKRRVKGFKNLWMTKDLLDLMSKRNKLKK